LGKKKKKKKKSQMQADDHMNEGAQHVTLDNKIKCVSLAVFCGNPTNKTIMETAYTWGRLIANHLDQSL